LKVLTELQEERREESSALKKKAMLSTDLETQELYFVQDLAC